MTMTKEAVKYKFISPHLWLNRLQHEFNVFYISQKFCMNSWQVKNQLINQWLVLFSIFLQVIGNSWVVKIKVVALARLHIPGITLVQETEQRSRQIFPSPRWTMKSYFEISWSQALTVITSSIKAANGKVAYLYNYIHLLRSLFHIHIEMRRTPCWRHI